MCASSEKCRYASNSDQSRHGSELSRCAINVIRCNAEKQRAISPSPNNPMPLTVPLEESSEASKAESSSFDLIIHFRRKSSYGMICSSANSRGVIMPKSITILLAIVLTFAGAQAQQVTSIKIVEYADLHRRQSAYQHHRPHHAHLGKKRSACRNDHEGSRSARRGIWRALPRGRLAERSNRQRHPNHALSAARTEVAEVGSARAKGTSTRTSERSAKQTTIAATRLIMRGR